MVGGKDVKKDRLASTELFITGDTEWREAGQLPQRGFELSATTVANTVYASGEYNRDSDAIQ